MTELKNKVALISGAWRGIGKAIAIELGVRGATVIGVDISQDAVNDINSYLKENSIVGEGMIMDVTNFDSIQNIAAQVKQKYAAPNIIVNNAGITRDNLFLRMKAQEWQTVIDTNLSSVFKVSQVFLRDMLKARWGKIVNIASVVAFTGNAGQTNYSAAKAGLIALSKSLAKEVASRNITVNVVAPGFIDTQMTRKLSPEQKELLLKTVPLAKVGTPKDVANAVGFLVSDQAAYITGTTLHVNGGMYME